MEDNPDDGELVQVALAEGRIECVIKRVDNRADFVTALGRGGIDLVLSDFSLPTFDGGAAVAIVRAHWPAIPIILVSGTLREELAIDWLQDGATDYVLKDRLARLAPAVRRAMREVEARRERADAEKLTRSERDFSESLNSLPGIFYLFDEAGTFLRWNKSFERVSGYGPEEIRHMKPLDFFGGDAQEFIAQKIQQVFTNGTVEAEADFLAKDGSRTPYYFTGQKIEREGRPCLIGTGIDISGRKRLEAQFIEAQKMEVLGRLASGVAHDFNNILMVIMGYSEMLATELGAESTLRRYTEEIRSSSERAVGLTRQLLVFSRKQTVVPVVLDLNKVVRDLQGMLGRLIGENVAMKFFPGNLHGHILADAGYLGQMVMNLVVNARDAMPDGGKLTIATENVTFAPGKAQAPAGAPLGSYVLLTVSDTGTGMTDDVKAHLYEAFFTTKPRGKGTGLGLATCQTIVQQCGGYIGLESEVGHGATFKIYLPCVDQPLDEAALPPYSEIMPRGAETLMLVEDDPSVRHLACSVLESLGYRVLQAHNGQDGLRAASAANAPLIRLVITDVIMPEMGGKIMAEGLKTVFPDVKILFTSGYTEDAVAHQGVLEAGVEFLAKPYTPAALARKVRIMLDGGTDTAWLRKQNLSAGESNSISPPASSPAAKLSLHTAGFSVK